MGVRVVFLLDHPLVSFLLKYKGVGAFLNKKMRNPNRESPLNNSIDKNVRAFLNKKKMRNPNRESPLNNSIDILSSY